MNISDREFASIFNKTLESTRVMKQQVVRVIDEENGVEGETPYIFILNRQSGGIRAHFLSLHPHKGYILPHIQHITWPKLKGWIDFRSIVHNNILYLMGGKEKETGKYTSKVMKYDPSEDKWTNLSNMKRSKAYFTINVMGSRIVITGGETSDGEVTDVIESYDPSIDSWSFEGRLPEPRKQHASAVVNSRLYICGGQGEGTSFNHNLWELKRELKMVGGKEIFNHQWYHEWGHVFTRKIQQNVLFEASGKLFNSGGLVQGHTEDGKKLADELDIDDANSDSDEEEERKKQRKTQPFVPSYLRLLADSSKQKKRGPKNITRTTRSKRVYMFGGYQLESDQLYVPRVDYYHTRKEHWYSAFNLMTYDNEIFRDVVVHELKVPSANPNFRVLTTAYKYPLW